MDAQKVGKRIQEVRKARGLTQAGLSQMLDLSTKYGTGRNMNRVDKATDEQEDAII